MSKVSLYATVAAVAVGVTFMGAASASPVSTYNGDPYPTGSQVIGVPTGGPTSTPFGTFDSASLTDLSLLSVTISGGNQFFTYDATVNLFYSNPSSTTTFTNGQLEVEVLNRSSLAQTGTFSALRLTTTFSGTFFGGTLSGTLSTPGSGTVIYSAGGPSGLLVDTTFLDLPSVVSLNGGSFIPAPLDSTTTSATPLPAALPLFGVGLGLVGWLARRRHTTAAPVAA